MGASPCSCTLHGSAAPARCSGLVPKFYDLPPVLVDKGSGSRFRDIDGHEYADFNIADISMFCPVFGCTWARS